MNDEHNRGVIERYRPAFDARDATVMQEITHDDLVTEWPQSGERIVGKDNCLVLLRNYPGGCPTRTDRRTIGCGEVWISESMLDYPGGQRAHFVSIFKLRDGRIARLTEFRRSLRATQVAAPARRRRAVVGRRDRASRSGTGPEARCP